LRNVIAGNDVADKECDLVYERLGKIYDAFIDSEYFKNLDISEYEALDEFTHNEMENILNTLSGKEWGE
jgi:hypothetical protein